MKKAALTFAVLFILSIALAGTAPRASAHEELIVGDVKIVGGWFNEPPLLNQFNGIELTITRNSTDEPITNAVAQLDVTVQKGAITKPLDFLPSEEPGVYVADIIPTQTGQYAISFRGTVAGQSLDGRQVEIEDVDDTRPLEFPTRQNTDPTIPTDLIEQLQGVIADLNTQVDQAPIASEQAVESAQAATNSATELKESADRAYLFGMVGVGVGVAGIVIGVVALSRRGDKV